MSKLIVENANDTRQCNAVDQQHNSLDFRQILRKKPQQSLFSTSNAE